MQIPEGDGERFDESARGELSFPQETDGGGPGVLKRHRREQRPRRKEFPDLARRVGRQLQQAA